MTRSKVFDTLCPLVVDLSIKHVFLHPIATEHLHLQDILLPWKLQIPQKVQPVRRKLEAQFQNFVNSICLKIHPKIQARTNKKCPQLHTVSQQNLAVRPCLPNLNRLRPSMENCPQEALHLR